MPTTKQNARSSRREKRDSAGTHSGNRIASGRTSPAIDFMPFSSSRTARYTGTTTKSPPTTVLTRNSRANFMPDLPKARGTRGANSELQAERIGPAVVVLRRGGWGQAVVVVEITDAPVPVAGQVEVEVQLVVDAVPAVDREARIPREPRQHVDDLQSFRHELGARVRLAGVRCRRRRVRVALVRPRQAAAKRQVLRGRPQ